MLDATPHTHPPKKTDAQPHSHAYAALDLGTNNCRLLIASHIQEPHYTAKPPSLKVIDSFSRIVRLGEGVSQTGKLSEEAMERTISALGICKKKLERHPIARARFVATEACRRAQNSKDFLSRVHDVTGLDIDIISAEEEARLAFLGCASLLTQNSQRAIVFDIGGGSTKLMWVDVDHVKKRSQPEHRQSNDHSITDWLSIDSGVMNLADRFGGHAFAEVAFNDMVKYIADRLLPFDKANQIRDTIGNSKVQLLSTSGTVTTLAAIHLELPRYDRTRIDGIKLELGDVRNTIQKLLSMRPSERFNHPCIGPDRADFIISGCAIFEAISRTWPTGEITIADRGVREGIIISLMHPNEH